MSLANTVFSPMRVEHFFINGGTRALISRVASKDAKCAEGKVPEADAVLSVIAKNPGAWGNKHQRCHHSVKQGKTQILDILVQPEASDIM